MSNFYQLPHLHWMHYIKTISLSFTSLFFIWTSIYCFMNASATLWQWEVKKVLSSKHTGKLGFQHSETGHYITNLSITPSMDAYRRSICGPRQNMRHSLFWDLSKCGVVTGTRNKILVWANKQVTQLSEKTTYLLSICFDFLYWVLLKWDLFILEGPIFLFHINWLSRDSYLLRDWECWASWCLRSHPGENLSK